MVVRKMNPNEIMRKHGDGLTYRQLDHWTTSGYLSDDKKSIGVGGRREYTAAEVSVLERMIALVTAGVKPNVASAVAKGDTKAYNLLADALEMCTHV